MRFLCKLYEEPSFSILLSTGEKAFMKSTLIGFLKIFYSKFIDILHFPFVKQSSYDPYHIIFEEFLSVGKTISSPTVLEIGSRNVTGITRRELFPNCKEYVGFDIHPGESVDIVGDVHNLSDCFSLEHFNLVYCISVFEHLLFPWKAVLEINKVMKTGGYLYLSTHPVWPEHESPWDFWRFPKNGFHALFNKYTGFEIISINEGLPCKAYSLVNDSPTRGLWKRTLNQGVALIVKKTSDYQSDLLKWDIEISEVITTMYPNKKAGNIQQNLRSNHQSHRIFNKILQPTVSSFFFCHSTIQSLSLF